MFERLHRDEQGMTLVELTISMAITSVMVAAIIGVLFSVQSGVERQIDRKEALAQSRLATQGLDRELRSALAFAEADGGLGLDAYTATNADTRGTENANCVEYKIDEETLWKRVWPEDHGGDAYGWTILAEGIQNDNATPMFEIDPDPTYGGKLLRITVVASEGESTVTVQQSLAGRNVITGADNPCTSNEPPEA